MKEGIEKPKCSGCDRVGMEAEYFWHNNSLWHISCCVESNLHYSGKQNLTKEEADEQFIKTMLENNRILKDNFDNQRILELEKFIKNVCLPKGIKGEIAKRILINSIP